VAVEGAEAAAALQADGGDKSLDFGCLGVGFGVLLLRALDLSSDDILSHIVLLAQAEELSDLGRALGTESLGEDVVGQPGDLALALLDDDEGEDGNVGTDDAPTDGLALALAVATSAVARVSVGEKEADTVGKQDTLFHGESLLVVPSGDADDVALEFIAYRVCLDFLGDFLVEKDAEAALLVEVDGLLLAGGGVCRG